MFKIFNNLLLMHLLTLMVTCVPKFVIGWCCVAKKSIETEGSNLNICDNCSK